MASLTYDGEVIIITDATTLFAQEFASLLAARGAKLVLNYPSTPTLARDGMNNGTSSVLDVFYDLEDAEKIVAAAVAKYGQVHALIQNASTRSPGLSYDLQSSRAWESMRSLVIDGAFKVPSSPTACIGH